MGIAFKLGAVWMAIGALGRHPYHYYTLLRWLVCGVAVLGAFQAVHQRKAIWAWTLAMVALLFNPVSPIHLKRETWAYIEIAVAAMLFTSISRVYRHPNAL